MGNIEDRRARKKMIVFFIKEVVSNTIGWKKVPKRKFLSLEIQSKHNVSDRKAKEYIDLACYELGLDKDFKKVEVQELL